MLQNRSCTKETARVLLALTLELLAPTVASAAESAAEPAAETVAETPDEAPEAFADEITVHAEPLQQIEERALEAQRRSLPIVEVAAPDQLGRFPDRDAAGAVQRLPGVTVLHDQGDARLVLVRGFLPSYNSATLDGERIPAGEADERAVALDLLPTELLEAVEVTKTLTPAMDGDAIGGRVDLVTRRPPRDRGRQASASLAGGHDDGSDGNRALVTARGGGWLPAKRLGASLSLSRLEADRGVQSVESAREGDAVHEVRRQDHTVTRDRSGLAASLEWHPAETSTVLVRSLWSEFEDLERRRAQVSRIEADALDGALASELKDRLESQKVEVLSLSADQHLGNWLLQPRLSWSRGEEEDADRLDTIFVAEDDEFVLEGFRVENDRSSNEDLVASLDLSRPQSSGRGTWRTGAKWRKKTVRRDDNLLHHEPDEDAEPVLLSAIVEAGWRPADPFFGDPEFDLGPFADPGLARALFARLGLEGRRDPADDLGDFDADEAVAAVYAMAEWSLGDNTSILMGARYEDTETTYLAAEISLDEEGEVIGSAPVRGGGSYGELLPSIIVRSAPGERDVLRAALTRSLARPGLEQLAPASLVVPEDEEILVGNPGLRPTTSWNLDLQWQRSLEPLGSISLSLYAKELSDVIAVVRTPGDPDAGSFAILQPRNAGDASVTGIELSFQNRFRSLPGVLGGLGLAANLTWSGADADLQGRPSMSLPGQAERSGSVVLSYEEAGLSARLLFSFRDEIIEELAESPDLDIFLQARTQLDLSVQFQATEHWSLFAEAFNLTEEDVRRFEGSPDRPVFHERVGWWATVGARFDL